MNSNKRSYLFSSTLLAAVVLLFALQNPFVTSAPQPSVPSQSNTPSASTTSPEPSPNPTGSQANHSVANGWYPGWLGSTLPPSNISWSKYNSLTFAFATTTPDSSVIDLDSDSDKLLHEFVAEASKNNVKAWLSIGGWAGSSYFANAVATQENRTMFSKAVVAMATNYHLDGINFAWEYPNRALNCRSVTPDESANFLTFLQGLRNDSPSLTLSAAVDIHPFFGSDGKPGSNVSEFNEVLDYIVLMNYGIWGNGSPTVGPNAPLNDSCAEVKAGSAVSAINAWTKASFNASKIILGITASGQGYYVNQSDATDSSGQLHTSAPFDKSRKPKGNRDFPQGYFDQCGKPATNTGIFDFNAMISEGFLNANGSAALGIKYAFESCSKTAFVYKPSSGIMIAFDDPQSLKKKHEFIDSNGLAGFSLSHIQADSHDVLVSAVGDQATPD